MTKKYSILSITRTTKELKKIVPVNECTNYQGIQ